MESLLEKWTSRLPKNTKEKTHILHALSDKLSELRADIEMNQKLLTHHQEQVSLLEKKIAKTSTRLKEFEQRYQEVNEYSFEEQAEEPEIPQEQEPPESKLSSDEEELIKKLREKDVVKDLLETLKG